MNAVVAGSAGCRGVRVAPMSFFPDTKSVNEPELVARTVTSAKSWRNDSTGVVVVRESGDN